MAVTGRERAREQARRRLAELRRSPTEVARKGTVNRQTVQDFLSGKSWPQTATRAGIERGLDWPLGTIDHLAGDTTTPPDPTADEPTHLDANGTGIVIGWPDDFSPEEREAYEAAITYEAFRRAQEIRASRRT